MSEPDQYAVLLSKLSPELREQHEANMERFVLMSDGEKRAFGAWLATGGSVDATEFVGAGEPT